MQKIKKAVNDFLKKNYQTLELYYKKPGDYEFTQEELDSFNVIPDLLMKNDSELCFAFVTTTSDDETKIYEWIKKNSDFLPTKIFRFEDEKLYEIVKGEKRDCLGEISIPEETTLKEDFLAKDNWERNRMLGKIGEEAVMNHLKKRKYDVLDLNYNSPDDTRSGIQNWREYQKLPDGIAKRDQEIFFFDAKGKEFFKEKKDAFIVNKRDYEEYQKKSEFLPVRIYFCLLKIGKNEIGEMYVHKVKDKIQPTQWMNHDKNVVVKLYDDVEVV